MFANFRVLQHVHRVATRIAEEQSTAGRRLLITFGGDGTISEVARGILRAGTGTELGLRLQERVLYYGDIPIPRHQVDISTTRIGM